MRAPFVVAVAVVAGLAGLGAGQLDELGATGAPGRRCGRPGRGAAGGSQPQLQLAHDLLADGPEVQADRGRRRRDRGRLALLGQQLRGRRARRDAPRRADPLLGRRQHRRQGPAAQGRRRGGDRRRPRQGQRGRRLPDHARRPDGLRGRQRADRARHDRAAAHGLVEPLAGRAPLPGHGRARQRRRAQAALPGPQRGGRRVAGAAAAHQGRRDRHREHRPRAVDRLPRPPRARPPRRCRCSRT